LPVKDLQLLRGAAKIHILLGKTVENYLAKPGLKPGNRISSYTSPKDAPDCPAKNGPSSRAYHPGPLPATSRMAWRSHEMFFVRTGLVTLMTFKNFLDANLAAGHLERAGIECYIQDENINSMYPNIDDWIFTIAK